VHKVQPIYPAEAIKAHLEGVVVLDLTITEQGQVEDVRRVSGPWLLVNPAAAAVTQWRFTPYVLDGQPIRRQTRVTITFKLAQ
jgi:protein TonB